MICRDCGWTGGINELCPACGGMDVIPREEVIERESVDMRMNERNEGLPAGRPTYGRQTGEHQELKIGIAYYLVGCFPAVPYETARHVADGMVEGMLRAMREAEEIRQCEGKIYGISGEQGAYSCSRRGTIERDGKWYCWQHDPERIKADREKRRAKREAVLDRRAEEEVRDDPA